MLGNKDLIIDYEEMLKADGAVTKLSPIYFRNADLAEKRVAALVRYVCEYILYLSPNEAANMLTMNILDKLKLKKMISDYVTFPGGLNEDGEKIRYLLSLAYPNAGLFSYRKWAREVFQKVLSAKKQDKKMAYPKKFFSGNNGTYNAMLCLDYMISISFDKTIPELYEFFADTPKITAMLKKYNLWTACALLYEKDPLLYLHFSLSDEDKDWFLFKYYIFKRDFEKIRTAASHG